MLSNPTIVWLQLVKERNIKALDALLDESVILYSPVVHTLLIGKSITTKYLSAAFYVFLNDSFRYVREISNNQNAVLEFEVELDGISVNGVDMIRWNEEGKITEFKVMIRPLKAVNLIHQKMAAMLQAHG